MLYSIIVSYLGEDVLIKTSDKRVRPSNSEVDRLMCDNSKLLKHTSWKPKYTLEQGIKEVVEWMKHRDNRTIYKAKFYNV